VDKERGFWREEIIFLRTGREIYTKNTALSVYKTTFTSARLPAGYQGETVALLFTYLNKKRCHFPETELSDLSVKV